MEAMAKKCLTKGWTSCLLMKGAKQRLKSSLCDYRHLVAAYNTSFIQQGYTVKNKPVF